MVISPVRRISLSDIHVRPRSLARGWLTFGSRHEPAALGRSGVRSNKREGDGATPRGRFRPVRVWWRADRAPRPQTLLQVRRIGPTDAWCEDPADRRYNRPIAVAPTGGGDRLWRDDYLYDLLIELDHNTRPRIKGRGSAIFVHAARPRLQPTAGCVALATPALRRLIARIGPKTQIIIH
jgi:L,D-peptidoglycan transpeptidase YkuD (ErfK/YbiS/YcfS/YnhG family)